MKTFTKLISFFKPRKKAIITEATRLSPQAFDPSVDELKNYCEYVKIKYEIDALIRKFNLIYIQAETDLNSNFKTMYYSTLLKISNRNK